MPRQYYPRSAAYSAKYWNEGVLAGMSILVNKDTRLLVQGITGREGAFHTQQMIDYGTNVVAGMTPGKGGTEAMGVPVFDTVKEAVKDAGNSRKKVEAELRSH